MDCAECASGLVLVDTASCFKLGQEMSVPSSLVRQWARSGSTQLIVYMELWPVLNAVRDALITRVASESNPGDDPSRGRAKRMDGMIGADHEALLLRLRTLWLERIFMSNLH